MYSCDNKSILLTLGHKTTDEQLSCVPAAPSAGGSAIRCYVNLLSSIWSEIAFKI